MNTIQYNDKSIEMQESWGKAVQILKWSRLIY